MSSHYLVNKIGKLNQTKENQISIRFFVYRNQREQQQQQISHNNSRQHQNRTTKKRKQVKKEFFFLSFSFKLLVLVSTRYYSNRINTGTSW